MKYSTTSILAIALLVSLGSIHAAEGGTGGTVKQRLAKLEKRELAAATQPKPSKPTPKPQPLPKQEPPASLPGLKKEVPVLPTGPKKVALGQQPTITPTTPSVVSSARPSSPSKQPVTEKGEELTKSKDMTHLTATRLGIPKGQRKQPAKKKFVSTKPEEPPGKASTGPATKPTPTATPIISTTALKPSTPNPSSLRTDTVVRARIGAFEPQVSSKPVERPKVPKSTVLKPTPQPVPSGVFIPQQLDPQARQEKLRKEGERLGQSIQELIRKHEPIARELAETEKRIKHQAEILGKELEKAAHQYQEVAEQLLSLQPPTTATSIPSVTTAQKLDPNVQKFLETIEKCALRKKKTEEAVAYFRQVKRLPEGTHESEEFNQAYKKAEYAHYEALNSEYAAKKKVMKFIDSLLKL